MSTTVTYKGATIATADNQAKTLLTAGKYMEDDIIIADDSGNVVDTLSGTLDTLGSDLAAYLNANGKWDDFAVGIQGGSQGDLVTVNMHTDASLIGFGAFFAPFYKQNNGTVGVTTFQWEENQGVFSFLTAIAMLWDFNALGQTITPYKLLMSDFSGNVTDMSPYAAYVSYSLDIIWHPMPSTP